MTKDKIHKEIFERFAQSHINNLVPVKISSENIPHIRMHDRKKIYYVTYTMQTPVSKHEMIADCKVRAGSIIAISNPRERFTDVPLATLLQNALDKEAV